jgi:hypothetical protein
VCYYGIHESDIVPYLYPVFNIWVEYPELLLFVSAFMCSLYLVRNVLSVLYIYIVYICSCILLMPLSPCLFVGVVSPNSAFCSRVCFLFLIGCP